MPIELLAFIPTALALTLLALAHGLSPKPIGWALIGTIAMALGPIAVWLLGFFMWLMLLAAGVVALTMYAAVRFDERPPLQQGQTGLRR